MHVEWPGGDELATAWRLPLVETYPTLPSTQDRAMELARGAAAPWTAVVAGQQISGRGRRGDAWESGRGLGLWMSIVLPPSSGPTPMPLQLGVAVAEGLEAVLDGMQSRVGVKWPNDVWIDGRKVAGVLVERTGEHTVAGIGVNLLHRPGDFGPELRKTATSLAQHGWEGDAVALGRSIFDRLRIIWDLSAAEVCRRLDRLDVLRGRWVVLEDKRSGRAAGVEEDGALRVCGENEEWRVYAGAVRLRTVRDG